MKELQITLGKLHKLFYVYVKGCWSSAWTCRPVMMVDWNMELSCTEGTGSELSAELHNVSY